MLEEGRRVGQRDAAEEEVEEIEDRGKGHEPRNIGSF